MESHLAPVHAARVPLCTRHCDHRAVGHAGGRVAGANHSWNAELAGDDRRVAGATTTVGDDRGSGLHDWLPVGRGGVGDEHLAGLEVRQMHEVLDPSHRTRGDPFADRPALGEYLAPSLEHVGLQRGHAVLGGDCLRAGLHDVELSVDTVLGPLHVHRPPVVLLDGARVAGQFQNVFVGEAEPGAVGFGVGMFRVVFFVSPSTRIIFTALSPTRRRNTAR